MQRSTSRATNLGSGEATTTRPPPAISQQDLDIIQQGSFKRVTWRKLLKGYALRTVLAMRSCAASKFVPLLIVLLVLLLAGGALLVSIGAWSGASDLVRSIRARVCYWSHLEGISGMVCNL